MHTAAADPCARFGCDAPRRRGHPYCSEHLPAITRCRDCGRRPAGERDALSPYCGTCDPYGARHYDDAATPAPPPPPPPDPVVYLVLGRPRGSTSPADPRVVHVVLGHALDTPALCDTSPHHLDLQPPHVPYPLSAHCVDCLAALAAASIDSLRARSAPPRP
jgi:hypothetical protein